MDLFLVRLGYKYEIHLPPDLGSSKQPPPGGSIYRMASLLFRTVPADQLGDQILG